jgi:hypothetical protein
MDKKFKIFQIITEKKIYFVLLYLFIVLSFFILLSEVIFRFKGIKPWQKDDLGIQVTPGGSFFAKHPTLGYTHLSGNFTITLKDGYSFRVTHLLNTLRVTHPLQTYAKNNKNREVWIFGCSFTHGWSLNDQETYPWLLQKKFPQYEVVNFGVSGYGTIHSLIQFQKALSSGKIPEIVILTYASFHDERYIFSRNRRKYIVPWTKLGPLYQPYARLSQNGKLNYYFDVVGYREFPLMRYSALIHFIEIMYNKYEDLLYQSHQVTKALTLEFARIAHKNNIILVVAGITLDSQTSYLLSFIKENGMMAVDISVDLNNKENTNFPHDNHPSASANKKYADKLEKYLRREVLEKQVIVLPNRPITYQVGPKSLFPVCGESPFVAGFGEVGLAGRH